MLLQTTALFLTWWVVTNRTDASSPTAGIGLFRGDPDWAQSAPVLVTTLLAIAPVPLMFLRTAAASWRHEPDAWRRDLCIIAGLQAVALASVFAWPIEGPFWGSRNYVLTNNTADHLTIATNPGIGWWLAVVALLLTVWAMWLSRRGRSPEGGQP